MAHTDRYRTQHAQIMQLAAELSQQLTPSRLAADATHARRILSDLSGKLIVHLAAEDNLLYPKLFQCHDPGTQAISERFAEEMGSIARTFKNYAVRWGSAAAIQSGAEEFVAQTHAIIDALSERIRRENTELYPLADKL